MRYSPSFALDMKVSVKSDSSSTPYNNVAKICRPIFFLSSLLGCTSVNGSLRSSSISSAHGVLTVMVELSITLYLILAGQDYLVVEVTSAANTEFDTIKVACVTLAASACTLTNIFKGKSIAKLIQELKTFPAHTPLRPRPFYRQTARFLCLSAMLIAMSFAEIVIIPPDFSPQQSLSFVEYYGLLQILASGYQFAAVVRVLEGMMGGLLECKRTSTPELRRSVGLELAVRRLSELAESAFGLQVLVALSVGFLSSLVSSYFFMLYVVKWVGGSYPSFPPSAIFYLFSVLFVFLELFEILSANHSLRNKVERFVLEIDELMISNTNKNLSSDAVLQTYLEGREEWSISAAGVLNLAYDLISDIVAAHFIYIVLLLQYGEVTC